MNNFERDIQPVLNLFKTKDFKKAELFCKQLLNLYPQYIWLYNFLGIVLTEQNKINEAIIYYEKGLKIDPKYSMIYNNLGSAYQLQKKYSKAESNFKKSIELDDKLPEHHNNLGNFYRVINKDKKAINSYKNAIKIKSNFFPSHYNLGITYKNLGNLNKAKWHLNESIKFNFELYPAHRALSEITKYKSDNQHLKLLNKIYENKISTNKKELIYALGKAYEDIKNFTKSFNFYNEANKLHRKTIDYNKDIETNEFRKIKEIFTVKLLKKFDKSGNKNYKIIFILGMPRSGTTLTEQIISSHPNVFAGGELNYIPALIEKYFKDGNKKISFDKINSFDINSFKNLRTEYIENFQKHLIKEKHITDKLPINFKWIGLIKLIFPDSKIIHCTRNSKDVCTSIFKNYFVSKELNFAYDLDEISHFYKLYIDLMNHWKKIIPEFIYDIPYENIISNPNLEIKNLIKKCNLSWNSNCLEFYKNKRTVKTVSDTQVRKKLYKTSVNSWKNFNKFTKNSFYGL